MMYIIYFPSILLYTSIPKYPKSFHRKKTTRVALNFFLFAIPKNNPKKYKLRAKESDPTL